MGDGLGMLDQQRERRTRRIPASKNPPRSRPVAVPETPSQLVELPTEVSAEPDSAKPETKEGGRQQATSKPPESVKPAVADPTVKMSIYLEHVDDLYLEEITHAGKTSRPRVAISRSAIVRLALERLGDAMSTDEVVAELRRRGDQHQGAGRKRR